MIIYFIVKILIGYFFLIKIKSEKKAKIADFIIDLLILILFIFISYLSYHIIFLDFLFYFGLFFITIFLLYRIINYIYLNFDYILSRAEKKERIKKFLLKPAVNKCVYYIIWSLPWNIMYWIYFWVMENGWYFRVWFSSNRDIFFWKYFKWDSRDFFFKINELLFNNFFFKFFKKRWNKFIEMFYRLIYIFFFIRKRLLEINILKYIWIRLVVYMYLCIFYIYFIFYLQLLNYYFIIIIFFLEFIILYNTRFFLLSWQNLNKNDWTKENLDEYKKNNIITQEFLDLIDFLMFPFFIKQYGWEINRYVWDKTLSNSVTLNILYKYMIWVNKNTEGYFDRQMNIRSRIHRKKYIEEKSIIWDVLPRTRYVFVFLKNDKYDYTWLVESNVTNNTNINIITNKNFFLSYYEKTYSNSSLLMLIYLLRNNNILWNFHIKDNQLDMYKNLSKNKEKISYNCLSEFIFINQHRLYYMIILYLFYKDKRLKYEGFLEYFVNSNDMFIDLEKAYFFNNDFIKVKAKELVISKKFVSMKKYKLMFKIMGRIQLYEEESIVWNKNLQEYLFHTQNSKVDININYRYNILTNNIIDKYTIDLNRFHNFSTLPFLHIYNLNDNSENFLELLFNINYNADNIKFFNKINDEDLLNIIYLFCLMVHLKWSNEFFFEKKPSYLILEEIAGFPAEIDFDTIMKKYKL